MMAPLAYDIIIVGAGPAGLALARSLAGTGLTMALVDRTSAAVLASPPCDGREIALTRRSVATLDRLGAWERLDAADIAPLREARVLDGDRAFALSFAGGDDVDRLGCLVANHRIRRSLFEALEGQARLALFAGAAIRSVRTSAKEAAVDLEDGRQLHGRLLVGADSRFSLVRRQLGIGARLNRLDRSMLLCRVAHDADHGGIATEWFGHGQTIAMLPLNGGHVSSAVLTLPAAAIERFAGFDAQALGAEITRRYRARLGAMRVVEGPYVYPLVTSFAHRFVGPRAAFVGDAAVGMHPVTAHGFNLGLQGAAKLAELVDGAAARGGDFAAAGLLRHYEAAHRLASAPLFAATNLIVGLYTDDRPAAAHLARPLALRAAARLPLLRRGVTRLLTQP
jgi:ubiquinone biosynthesis UbiH/UbiF/VisC/COQ6 family hydroxylase